MFVSPAFSLTLGNLDAILKRLLRFYFGKNPMSDGPITLNDCAELASGVYKNLDRVGAWHRIRGLVLTTGSSNFDDSGYLSAPYLSGRDVILAFRGTHNQQSGKDDGFMAPITSLAIAKKVSSHFFRLYTGKDSSKESSDAFGTLVWAALQANNWHKSDWGTNMLPDGYILAAQHAIREAYDWCYKNHYGLRCFVGHSLGGALAQFAAEQGGKPRTPRVPAVSINGPSMGKIKGMRQNNSAGIMTLNSAYDPLSKITALAGNSSHADEGLAFELPTKISKVPSPPDPKSYGLEYRDEDSLRALIENTLRGSAKDVMYTRFIAEFTVWLTTKLGPALLKGHSVLSVIDALKEPNGTVRGETRLSHYFASTKGS
jgi:hypothetical protein